MPSLCSFKPMSCLVSRTFTIFWNRKKFVLPFTPLLLKIVPDFHGLRHKKLCPKLLYFSCLFSRFSPAFFVFLLHFLLLFFSIFLMLFPALNLDLFVSFELLLKTFYSIQLTYQRYVSSLFLLLFPCKKDRRATRLSPDFPPVLTKLFYLRTYIIV